MSSIISSIIWRYDRECLYMDIISRTKGCNMAFDIKELEFELINKKLHITQLLCVLSQ